MDCEKGATNRRKVEEKIFEVIEAEFIHIPVLRELDSSIQRSIEIENGDALQLRNIEAIGMGIQRYAINRTKLELIPQLLPDVPDKSALTVKLRRNLTGVE